MGMDSTKYGGLERFNVALSNKLEENGIRSVFIYESYPESQGFVDDLTKTSASLLVSNSRKHPLKFCIDFIKTIIEYRPVIVHAHFTKARFYAIPLAWLLGVKRLFFTIHSGMDPKCQIKPWTRTWFGLANKIARVIVVSDSIASVYTTNWPDAQVKRIYLGVSSPCADRDESRKHLGIPDRMLMLLTVANFNHIKGLDILVKAVALLVEQGRWDQDACLFIVGQPEQDMKELKKMIDEMGIEDVVKMQGISNEVACYMAAADFYIQPSRSEGIGLALMEAASYSLPLIGSRVGGIPEVVKDGENGFLVQPEDEVQLAERVYDLMQDSHMRKRFGEKSFTVFEESFSIQCGVRETFEYYCS